MQLRLQTLRLIVVSLVFLSATSAQRVTCSFNNTLRTTLKPLGTIESDGVDSPCRIYDIAVDTEPGACVFKWSLAANSNASQPKGFELTLDTLQPLHKFFSVTDASISMTFEFRLQMESSGNRTVSVTPIPRGKGIGNSNRYSKLLSCNADDAERDFLTTALVSNFNPDLSSIQADVLSDLPQLHPLELNLTFQPVSPPYKSVINGHTITLSCLNNQFTILRPRQDRRASNRPLPHHQRHRLLPLSLPRTLLGLRRGIPVLRPSPRCHVDHAWNRHRRLLAFVVLAVFVRAKRRRKLALGVVDFRVHADTVRTLACTDVGHIRRSYFKAAESRGDGVTTKWKKFDKVLSLLAFDAAERRR